MAIQQKNNNTLRQFVIGSFSNFFQSTSAAGVLIMAGTLTAILWVNSPLGYIFDDLIHTKMYFSFGAIELKMSFEHMVNDGLMVIFFLFVGLEIKREMLIGELASAKKAALPMIAAIFGMIVPAAIYAFINWGTPAIRGWGVPVATDIAFALGILALLGSRVPIGLKVFLAALAIVDDLLSVLIIALFYTSEIDMTALLSGLGVIAFLTVANRVGVRSLAFYSLFGLVLWFMFLNSGVHATISGVLLALVIPVRSDIKRKEFFEESHSLVNNILKTPEAARSRSEQLDVIHALEKMAEKVQSPLYRMEHWLQPYVYFVIMPVFALVNSGIHLDPSLLNTLTSPVSLGIIIGLFVGKQIAVTVSSWLAIKIGIAEVPEGANLKTIYGVSLLCGIGFTMALFVAQLAFLEPANLETAKIGILTGSAISALTGVYFLRKWLPKAKLQHS